MMVRMRVAIVVGLVAGCAFAPGTPPSASPPDASPDADSGPPALHLRIEAWIDGRSDLIVVGNTAHWHHYDYAAPGREMFVNKPTLFDGVEWFPVWPNTM